MVISVAWVFRVGLAGSIRLSGGGAVDSGLTMGPFAEWLGTGSHVVLLGVVPVYLWACARQQPPSQSAVAAAVVTLTIVAGASVCAATLGIFGPTV